jgi:hypothetical protein
MIQQDNPSSPRNRRSEPGVLGYLPAVVDEKPRSLDEVKTMQLEQPGDGERARKHPDRNLQPTPGRPGQEYDSGDHRQDAQRIGRQGRVQMPSQGGLDAGGHSAQWAWNASHGPKRTRWARIAWEMRQKKAQGEHCRAQIPQGPEVNIDPSRQRTLTGRTDVPMLSVIGHTPSVERGSGRQPLVARC